MKRIVIATAVVTATAGTWLDTTFAAQSIYACRDQTGRAHSADRPVADCLRTAMRELRGDGMVKREIPAFLDGEELRRHEAEMQRRMAEQAARRDAEQRDRALQMRYPTEAALDSLLARQTTRLQDEIDAAIARILENDQVMKAAIQQRDAASHRGSAHDALQQRVLQSAYEILVEDAVVQMKREEIVRTRARFEEDRKRLRQLLGGANAAGTATAALRRP